MSYIIRSRTHGTYVHALDHYSTPSVTDDPARAKRYRTKGDAARDAVNHGIDIPENDIEYLEYPAPVV